MKHKYHVTTAILLVLVSIFHQCHSIQSSKSLITLTRNEIVSKREFRSCSRGGSNHNANNYSDNVDPNRFMPPTLADLDNNYIRRPILNNTPTNEYHSYSQTADNNASTPPKPLAQSIQEYANKLLLTSPTIYYGSLASILIFILFQIPALLPIIRNHFVCSALNLKHRRAHTLLSSALSHATLTHLAMNLYAFQLFGRAVTPDLRSNGISLTSYCTAAALFANTVFLLAGPRGSSCVGLSGVALSLLALDAKLRPGKELAFLVRFVPVRLPAAHALTLLLVWSALGTVGTLVTGNSGGVAHGTHLGGLLFGVLFYEGLERGLVRDCRMAFLRVKGRLKKKPHGGSVQGRQIIRR